MLVPDSMPGDESQKLMLSVFPNHFPSLEIGSFISTEPEAHWLTGLVSQWTPRNLMSLPSHRTNYRQMPPHLTFYVDAGDGTQVLTLVWQHKMASPVRSSPQSLIPPVVTIERCPVEGKSIWTVSKCWFCSFFLSSHLPASSRPTHFLSSLVSPNSLNTFQS